MDSSELRIGNYVNFEFKSGVDKISIFPKDLFEMYKREEVKDMLSPIPLTEEWLIKFGFRLLRKDEFNDYTQIVYGKSIIVGDEDNSEKLVIYLPFNRCEIGEYNPKDDDYSYILNIDINYVHQAQNLFYSLTNTEL